MRTIRLAKWMAIICCMVVCLSGISYAYYTDQITINADISTGNMGYSFAQVGEVLYVTITSPVSDYLLSMNKGETYAIEYQISEDNSETIPLKVVDQEYIASISIHMSSYICRQNGVIIQAPLAVTESIPTSLGTFDCYHSFDGINGVIILEKKSDPLHLTTYIDKEVLSSEELNQLMLSNPLEGNDDIGAAFEMIQNTRISNEIPMDVEKATEDMEKDGKLIETEVEKGKISDVKEDESSIVYDSYVSTVATITIEAYYEFTIPLVFDQYNVQ